MSWLDADHLDRVLGAINRALADQDERTPGFADAPIILSYDELRAIRRWIVNEPEPPAQVGASPCPRCGRDMRKANAECMGLHATDWPCELERRLEACGGWALQLYGYEVAEIVTASRHHTPSPEQQTENPSGGAA
jgi:hypothetical protein